MILGIDASNIRSGGGLTHLVSILEHTDFDKSGFEKVVVWSNHQTLKILPEFEWLSKRTHKWLNRGMISSFAFQILKLSRKAKKEKCVILFVPGSTFLGSFRPFVTLSQNMLPFEKNEASRFPKYKDKIRFKILFLLQSFTFKNASGLIFLTNYAKHYISTKINLNNNNVTIIPHGISSSFLNAPKEQKDIKEFNSKKLFKFLYVSIVTVYKHQWNVAEAIFRLKKEGYPIQLDLIGHHTSESLEKLNLVINRYSDSNAVNYLGNISHEKISYYYKDADAFIFASTCENMPIILVEAMTAGLPIASSMKQPMPEVLGNGGLYFDSLSIESIYLCLKELLNNQEIRSKISNNSYLKTKNYTWDNCSSETFKFIKNTAESFKN